MTKNRYLKIIDVDLPYDAITHLDGTGLQVFRRKDGVMNARFSWQDFTGFSYYMSDDFCLIYKIRNFYP